MLLHSGGIHLTVAAVTPRRRAKRAAEALRAMRQARRLVPKEMFVLGDEASRGETGATFNRRRLVLV